MQSVGRDGTKDITFTVSKDNGPLAVEILNDEVGGFQDVVCDTQVAKVSIVGAGMESHPGTASKMFEALYERDINIQMISTSEIKISVLVAEEDADKAVSPCTLSSFRTTDFCAKSAKANARICCRCARFCGFCLVFLYSTDRIAVRRWANESWSFCVHFSIISRSRDREAVRACFNFFVHRA